MEFICKTFPELTTTELYDILQVRAEVFVVEQNCIYQDMDGVDLVSHHLYLKENDDIVAYLRVIPAGVVFPEVAIGRVLTTKRRCGLGTQILTEGISVAKNKLQAKSIQLHAQVYAKEVYEKLGFQQSSEEFLEDDIPHIAMILQF